MRIAFIGGRGVAAKYSGIETYYEAVGAELATRHDVRVYCRSYFTPPVTPYRGMRVVRLPTLRMKHLETLIHSCLSTLHAIATRCEIIHFHAIGSSLFAPMARLGGAKIIVSVQGLDWKREKWGALARVVLQICERTALRCPDATIVVSRALRDHFHDKYGATVYYVPNGVTAPRRRELNLLKKWGLRAADYVLFLGRLSPEKKCHLLLDAFEGLDTQMKLVVAGGGPENDAYVRALRARRGDRVLFPGYVEGEILEELLSNAALFVLPSSVEGLSIALLEAMSYGLCVVASDIPENRELVEGAGYLFEPGDVQALRSTLSELLPNEPKRHAAGARGAQRIASQYQWAMIATETERIYKRVMTG